MNREEYIESNILKLLHHWTNIATGIGSLAILSLSILDYFVTPANFKTFFLYRIFTAIAIWGTYLFNKQKIDKNRHHIVMILASVFVSTMVALMIAKFGGHQSTYFAGFLLTIVFVVGLAPLNIKMCILSSSIIYAIYLIPILIYDTISNPPFFINANVFIIAIIFSIILFRYLTHQRFVSEFGLQYDIEQQKAQLEVYSQNLEDLVRERTKELAISETWHRSIFDNATDGIMVLNKKGEIVNVNRKTCELHGFDRDALIGIHIDLLESKGEKEKQEERLSRILNGETLIYETEHYKKDGEKILLEISSKSLEIEGDTYVQSFCRDISEKKRIQEQLLHSQKMESVGALAGGIAHNFNNILTAILGYSELLLEFSELDDTSKQRVRNIESAARKAGVMVSKLLSFSRRDSHEVLPMNLNDIVNDSVKLFEGVLDKRIGLKINLCENLHVIEGDPNQLEQVLMNLMVNARDAMPDGGLITIKTGVIEIGRNGFINTPAYIKAGKYIFLSVSDTGCGIPAEIRDRIFDPFFTTKEKGKGTGLGLASVYGIVKDHKGYISFQSEVEKGTTFDIYLPVSERIVPRLATPKTSSIEGSESILLIDDDKDVMNLIRDILESYGYTVMPFNNPLTAVEIFKNQSSRIQLVITDIMMPLMEGAELIKNLRKVKPDIKIIAISGYTDTNIINNKEIIADAFVKKPFEKIEILSTVRRLIDTGIRNLPLY
jgi:two-component system, cell cycle sensor histidine kinase and response regulator CckA